MEGEKEVDKESEGAVQDCRHHVKCEVDQGADLRRQSFSRTRYFHVELRRGLCWILNYIGLPLTSLSPCSAINHFRLTGA